MEYSRRRTAQAQPGFVLLPEVFAGVELAELRQVCEAVIQDVVERAFAVEGERDTIVWADGHRLQEVGGATVHWEPEASRPTVRSLQPVTQLDARLDALWTDVRLADAARELLGVGRVGPFTSKFNLKRAGVGSEYRWHQDYPFWHCCAGPGAREVVTVMIFLDDAKADNGAMRLLPGSQLAGPAIRDRAEPTGLLVDDSSVDTTEEVTIEAEAGSVLLFPSLLVHRSGPNRSPYDRRALLLCFQPAGRSRLQDLAYCPERLEELP